jgi:hypothetical protein
MSNRPLTVEQRRALWSRYQPAVGAARGLPPRRRPQRVAYDTAAVAVRITHPGGGSRSSAVYAHDLSTGGLSFLYPGFLHAGTAVSVALRKHAGGEAVAHGRVVWCRHVGGLWHGVGVGFVGPISTVDFVDPAGPAATIAPIVTPGNVAPLEMKPEGDREPGGLAGRVLYLEGQELDQGLFLHTVRRTRLKVTAVGNVASAVSAAAAGDFDLVCVELNLGPRQPTGERAMAEIRAAGYGGPFVIVTAETGDRLEAALAAADGGTGEPRVVAKPYAASELLTTLAASLADTAAAMATLGEVASAELPDDLPPLASQLAGQDGMLPLLRSFCDRAAAAAADLDRLLDPDSRADGVAVIDHRSTVGVRQICQMLRAAGRGYGYPAVSAAADAALRVIEEELAGPASAAIELRALQAVCRRLVA